MKTAPAKSKKTERPVEMYYLEELQFDLRNPRYGTSASNIRTEREALDHIVETFGVDDVMSSIAVNGFFESEPLVGVSLDKGKRIKIIEGNRRLAACLILAGDERAAGQARLRERFSELYKEHGKKRITPIPVIVYDGKDAVKEILPYIGIRHIVGFLEWDYHRHILHETRYPIFG